MNNTDPSGYMTLGEQLAVVTTITVLANIGTSLWVTHTAARSGFRIDGYIFSVRWDGFVRGGTYGGGIDAIYDNRSHEWWFSFAIEGGLDPLSMFQGHRQGGYSIMGGVIFDMPDPNLMAGAGILATWPISVLHLMPYIGFGKKSIWGAMTQFAKNARNSRGWSVGFGKSLSGPAFMSFGPSARQFSWLASGNTNYIRLSELSSRVQDGVRFIIDYFNSRSIIQHGSDFDGFCSSADQVLADLSGF